jgi:hypothetical protein
VFGTASDGGKLDDRNLAVPVLGALTAAQWVVYYATTPSGQRYIGITKDFFTRRQVHLNTVVNGVARFTEVVQKNYPKMDYFSAKALEQRLIELGGGPGVLANRINSIAPNNKLYDAAKGWGNMIIDELKKCGHEAPPGIGW